MAKQIIASCDPLRSFKEDAFTRYSNCSVFEYDVNGIIDIGIVEYKGNLVREKIITDGKISLHKKIRIVLMLYGKIFLLPEKADYQLALILAMLHLW